MKLWDRIRDWVLLGVLLGVSGGVMLTQNAPFTRSVRAGALELTAQVEGGLAWMGSYFRALEANDRLRRQNIELSSEVARSREARLENDRLRQMLALRDTFSYSVTAARIISKEIARERNLFTVNVGREDSVRAGMAVISERGILGKVVLVSPHYARVMPYLNTDFSVPAKILPIQTNGIVRWDGERSDRLLLEHVPRTEPVRRGQLVVTSGYSGVFPPGLPVGTVDSVSVQPGRSEYRLFLRPSALITRAEYVFVILHRPDPEQVTLAETPIR